MTRKELNDWLDRIDWGSYEILSDEDGYVRILFCIEDHGREVEVELEKENK